MNYMLTKWQRPIGRIDHVLSRLKKIWHYYPEYGFHTLVLQTAIYANHAESDLPLAGLDEMEDIAYPEGHLLHGIRNLEMGIDWLEKHHENEPLPPIPIQTSDLPRFADYWRRRPQQRLGQIMMDERRRAERDEQRVANG